MCPLRRMCEKLVRGMSSPVLSCLTLPILVRAWAIIGCKTAVLQIVVDTGSAISYFHL